MKSTMDIDREEAKAVDLFRKLSPETQHLLLDRLRQRARCQGREVTTK